MLLLPTELLTQLSAAFNANIFYIISFHNPLLTFVLKHFNHFTYLEALRGKTNVKLAYPGCCPVFNER